MKKVNKIFNKTIFGTKTRPYTFSVPYDTKLKIIDDITLDGNHCRELLYNFTPLINYCVVDAKKRDSWTKIIDRFILAFEMLRKKEDLSKEEVATFQLHVDIFFHVFNRSLVCQIPSNVDTTILLSFNSAMPVTIAPGTPLTLSTGIVWL